MVNKIRVLLSVGSLGIGGNEQFAMNLFRNIDKSKFDVDFVVFDKDRLNYYQEIVDDGSYVYFCNGNSKNKLLRIIEEGRKVENLLKNNNYDIIHCNSCSFLGLLKSAIPGKRIGKVKVISHAHNPGMPKKNVLDKALRLLLKAFTSSIVDYGFSCSDLASYSKYSKAFITSNRHFIIHNAIDVEKFEFSAEERALIRKKLSIPKDTSVIGHVGRLEYQKNHTFLLDVFAEYQKKHVDSMLLLVGDGSLRNVLEEKAKKLGIMDKVIFAGFQNNAEKFYNAMDCIVMPSHYEGFPFVVVEAQINGLKCLLSDSITKTANITGYVEYASLEDDIEIWCDHISKIINKRISKESIDLIRNDYDLKHEIKRIEQLYMKLVEHKE